VKRWVLIVLTVFLIAIVWVGTYGAISVRNDVKEEASTRCEVIKAIIEFAAPAKPVTLPVPATADPALREAIDESNRRAVTNNQQLHELEKRYLPETC
jgi:hypothetical protein